MNNISNINLIPTTRYQGSKRKLLPWIYSHLKSISFQTVLDVFGGTGSVSYLFKSMGKSVTYNDYLRFNSIIGKSIIENSIIKLEENDVQKILNSHSSYNFITANFKDVFFLDKENAWIDKVVCGINKLAFESQKDLEYKRAIAYNALFQSCLIKRPFNLFHRKNLYLRTNDVKRNFGNKVTWDREFEFYFRKFVKEINHSVFDSGFECNVTNNDVYDIDPSGYDLIYLDPPYVLPNCTNESANYLKCYHFLEGVANYDTWNDHIDLDSRIFSLKHDFLPNRFRPSSVHETFENIIYKFRNNKIAISYKYGGTPSISYIVELLKKHGKTVSLYNIHYQYALNKQNGNAKMNREYLIIGI